MPTDEPAAELDEERTYYGDPQDSVESLMGFKEFGPPKDDDVLCDGHQAHYEWRDGRWQ